MWRFCKVPFCLLLLGLEKKKPVLFKNIYIRLKLFHPNCGSHPDPPSCYFYLLQACVDVLIVFSNSMYSPFIIWREVVVMTRIFLSRWRLEFSVAGDITFSFCRIIVGIYISLKYCYCGISPCHLTGIIVVILPSQLLLLQLMQYIALFYTITVICSQYSLVSPQTTNLSFRHLHL